MARRILQVIITGDEKDASQAFDRLDADAGESGSSIGAKFAKVGGLIAVGVGTGAIVAAAALFKIGETFDEQYDKIRTGTGKTGKELEGLKDDFKQVVQDVPTDFGSAGDAITAVVQKLGLAGPQLQTVAEQFLEVSRITKTDLATNLQTGTDALNNWAIPAEQQPATLDKIYRATQLSGMGFSDLSQQLADSGTVLRASGLDFDQAIGLVAALGKEGISTSDVLPALSRSLATAAKEGKPAAQVLQDTFDAIRNAPDDTAAASAAMEVFGTKAGPKLAQLVREGKLSYQDMMGAIVGGKDTIIGAGKETQDFAEKWEMFKNKVLVRLEPIATAVFSAVGKAMDELPGILDDIEAKGEKFVAWIDSLDIHWAHIWQGIQDTVGTAVDWITGTAWPALQQAFDEVSSWVDSFSKFFAERWDKIKEAVHNVVVVIAVLMAPLIATVQAIWDHIQDIFRVAWDLISGLVRAGVDIVKGIIDVALGILTLDFDQAWQGIKEIFGGAWDYITQLVSSAVAWVGIVIAVGWEAISSLTSAAWGAIAGALGGAWEWIKGIASAGANALIDIVMTPINVLVGAWGGAWGAMVGAVNFASGVIGAIAGGIIGGVRAVWNTIADAINGIDFDFDGVSVFGAEIIPSIHIHPHLPKLHTGGIVPGRPGEEVLALLEAGERVIPANKAAAAGGSPVVINVKVEGHVRSDQDLAEVIRSHFIRGARRKSGAYIPGIGG